MSATLVCTILWALATLDCTLAGFGAASGKNALIDKRRFFRRALIRGFCVGQIAVLSGAAVVGAIVYMSSDPTAEFRDFTIAGERMIAIYAPFALFVGGTLAFRLIPSVDVRSMTSVLVFGPMALARPLVAAAGIAYGVLAAPRMEIVLAGAFVLAMMLSPERLVEAIAGADGKDQP